eukprot:COSAG02_NODE_5282_length_4473_cov_3.860768_3_plen_200_part_00
MVTVVGCAGRRAGVDKCVRAPCTTARVGVMARACRRGRGGGGPGGENEELQRLREELRQAKSDAQKAVRKLAKQEERPELVLARQAGHHQTNERKPWEHADWARSQIERIYEEHRPEKLPSVDSLMKAWLGTEDELLAQIQAKYQPDSESVAVRKLKHQVARLRDERNRVRRDLEQRASELAEEKADLEQGWNSAHRVD